MAAGTQDLTAPVGANAIIETTAVPIIRSHTITGADITAKKGAAIEANEIVQGIKVYAGEYVKNVYARINTASTASGATLSVGDGSDVDGWIPVVACDAAAGTTVLSTGAYIFTQATTTEKPVTWVGGKLYDADDTIDCKILSTTIDATVFSMDLLVELIPAK